jgi:hypothetical protein
MSQPNNTKYIGRFKTIMSDAKQNIKQDFAKNISAAKSALGYDNIPLICIADPQFVKDQSGKVSLNAPKFVYHKNGKYYPVNNFEVDNNNVLIKPDVTKVKRNQLKTGGRKTVHRKRKHRKLNTRRKK